MKKIIYLFHLAMSAFPAHSHQWADVAMSLHVANVCRPYPAAQGQVRSTATLGNVYIGRSTG